MSVKNIYNYRDYVSSENTGPQICTDTADILQQTKMEVYNSREVS